MGSPRQQCTEVPRRLARMHGALLHQFSQPVQYGAVGVEPAPVPYGVVRQTPLQGIVHGMETAPPGKLESDVFVY